MTTANTNNNHNQNDNMKTYYSLLQYSQTYQRWEVEFGDYDLSVVEDEKLDAMDAGVSTGHLKIIATLDDQKHIEAELKKLNSQN